MEAFGSILYEYVECFIELSCFVHVYDVIKKYFQGLENGQ